MSNATHLLLILLHVALEGHKLLFEVLVDGSGVIAARPRVLRNVGQSCGKTADCGLAVRKRSTKRAHFHDGRLPPSRAGLFGRNTPLVHSITARGYCKSGSGASLHCTLPAVSPSARGSGTRPPSPSGTWQSPALPRPWHASSSGSFLLVERTIGRKKDAETGVP